jgi:hypothetical protein
VELEVIDNPISVRFITPTLPATDCAMPLGGYGQGYPRTDESVEDIGVRFSSGKPAENRSG